MPSAKPPQTLTAAGSFTLNPAPGDVDFFLGVSPTVGKTAYSGVTFKVEGTRGISDIWYDIGVFTGDLVGPLAGPVAPENGASVAYDGDCRKFTQLRVTLITITGGSVSFELITGFFGSAPIRSVGAGGTVGVSGTVSVASGSRGDVAATGAEGISSFQLVLDPETLERLDNIAATLERIEEFAGAYLSQV